MTRLHALACAEFLADLVAADYSAVGDEPEGDGDKAKARVQVRTARVFFVRACRVPNASRFPICWRLLLAILGIRSHSGAIF